MNKQPLDPSTGDLVIGLQWDSTGGHWLIKEIRQNNDGTLTILFLDYHDDEPFWWTGTIEEYHDGFVYELDYYDRRYKV